MELSDTKSQDRYSMTDTVNSEDLNERIQDIIRQHYGQRDTSSSARKRSFPLMRSSSKKRSITPQKVASAEFDENNNPNSGSIQKSTNKKLSAICQSPSEIKYQQRNSTGQINNEEFSNRNSNQAQYYSPNNNSLLKYSPSTQAPIIERSDFKEGDYQNGASNHIHYLLENGFSSRKQVYLEASAIHEDINESDQTIIYPLTSQKSQGRAAMNGQLNSQTSPVFSKSINSDVGYLYKTFNEEDSQTDIKNLINKLDKKNGTNTNLNNLTQNTSYSFLNGGSATKTTNQNLNKNQQKATDQNFASQISQQNLSEILPCHLFQNYQQQQSNLPYLLKQQKEYESNESVNRMSVQTSCIQNLENSLQTLQEAIKKLTIKQLTAIKMMVKPLDCVQQMTVCIVSLVKDGRRIMESFDINRSILKTESDEAIEDMPWKSLQEYFASPGRLMNELSRIADIIEMNQVTGKSIEYCKNTVELLQELQIPDNLVLQEQMLILLNYIKAVLQYHDYKMQLNQLIYEEQEALKKINFEKKMMMKQQQIVQKENIYGEQRNFKKDTSASNFSSKSSRADKNSNQNSIPHSRKQSHDRQSNMTFGQSVCSDSQRNMKNVLQPPKQTTASLANSQSNFHNSSTTSQKNNLQNNNFSQLHSSQHLSTSIVVKTPIKNQEKNIVTPNKQSVQKRLSASSSHKEILLRNSSKKNIKASKNDRSLSKSTSQKLDLKNTDLQQQSSSRSGINLPKQLEITNTREVKKTMNTSSSVSRQMSYHNTGATVSTRSSNRLNTSCSSINSNNYTKNNNCPLNQTQQISSRNSTTNNNNPVSRNSRKESTTERDQPLSSKSQIKKEQSQSSLMQHSTQSTRSRYSTQLSDENRQNSQINQGNQLKSRNSSSSKRQDSLFSMQNRNNPKNSLNSPMSNKSKTNSCYDNLSSSIQSSQNRQRSLSQTSRNSSSQKDLKSRNEAAANSKISRLDKILNLKVRKPDVNSCVKNIISNPDEYNLGNNSLEHRSSRNTSQTSKQKLSIQKQINQEKSDILTIKQKKSKLDFYLERENKQKMQETKELGDKIDNEWKLLERERLHGFIDDQKRREKQLIKEMNEESVKCSKTVKQIQEWEDHQHQNHQHQVNSQKERGKREESDMLHFKKQNAIDERHQKSMNSQKSILENSVNYQEEDFKRLNNELKDQQKRKKDLEDTLERTLDVIYNYRKISCYKQL